MHASRTIEGYPAVGRRHMQEGHSRLFANPAMQALFARELTALTPILSGVYGSSGLFIQPDASGQRALPTHLLGHVVKLSSIAADLFSGDVRTASHALPFANDSFQLIVAQHSLECVDDLDACASELSRMLAPEGVLLVLGFNPLGTWRPWLAWQAARGAQLRLRSSSQWRERFARNQIDTLQVRYPGMLLPNDSAEPPGRYSKWITETFSRFGSSWLLMARKRRITLTPLRLRNANRERVLNPRLAPGAHRARA